jgi:transcriptional regulator with XRE-family HTH domain
MVTMPRTSTPSRRKTPTEKDRTDLRKRVGTFVRTRREQLGLSQGDIIAVLGYVSRNSVSNIETGREGLPAKRIYAWADVLEVPRDSFFRFVTGETTRMDSSARAAEAAEGPPARSGAGDSELLVAFRKLPSKYQRRLREQIKEFTALARTDRAK